MSATVAYSGGLFIRYIRCQLRHFPTSAEGDVVVAAMCGICEYCELLKLKVNGGGNFRCAMHYGHEHDNLGIGLCVLTNEQMKDIIN